MSFCRSRRVRQGAWEYIGGRSSRPPFSARRGGRGRPPSRKFPGCQGGPYGASPETFARRSVLIKEIGAIPQHRGQPSKGPIEGNDDLFMPTAWIFDQAHFTAHASDLRGKLLGFQWQDGFVVAPVEQQHRRFTAMDKNNRLDSRIGRDVIWPHFECRQILLGREKIIWTRQTGCPANDARLQTYVRQIM